MKFSWVKAASTTSFLAAAFLLSLSLFQGAPASSQSEIIQAENERHFLFPNKKEGMQIISVPGWEEQRIQVPEGTLQEVIIYNIAGNKILSSKDTNPPSLSKEGNQDIFFISIRYQDGQSHTQKLVLF